MAHILHIETATDTCSVAITKNEKLLSLRENHGEKKHSELLTVFIEEVLAEAGIKAPDLDAVAVSKGPGSYTGLRIGVATAKGICFALDKPLIAINTLQSMAAGMRTADDAPGTLYCPMIDARRQEVYCALFDQSLNFIEPTQALILDTNSFSEKLKEHKIIFAGDGSGKFRSITGDHTNAVYLPGLLASAKNMISLVHEAYEQKHFEDLAYFEPYYLKEFYTKSNA